MPLQRTLRSTGKPPRSVVLLTYEGGQILDTAGSAAVFTEANEFAGGAAYEVRLASPQGGMVLARGGLGLATVPVLLLDPRQIDTLIVSGGVGEPLAQVMRHRELAAWVRRAAKHVRRLASTCTGAFALAHWGLLDGHRAATHWQAAALLRESYPKVDVDADALFVEDGRCWTSAGVSTAIDMAMAMVERDLGRALTTAVAQRLVLQTRRPGHQAQFSSVLLAQGGHYAELVQWMLLNLNEDLSVDALARRAHQSVRTFCRRFTAETGSSPAAFVEQLRLDRARTLLEAGEPAKSVATLAGFGTQGTLWRSFNRAFALNPSTYRALHGKEAERSVPER